MDSEEPEVTDAPLPACTEAMVSVAAAESARVTFDGDYVAGPMLFTDTEVTLVKISSEDYTTEDFCTVPMPACLGTVTVGDVLYAACSDGATSILAKCSSEGEYLGAIEITAQLANDMTAYDGMIYLTDTSMDLGNYSPLGNPQLICIDIETEEVSYINLADYGLVAANGVTISPEMTVIVPDMYSPLILEFSTQGEKIGEYQLDIGTDGIVYSPSLNGYVVGNAYGMGVYLVKEDFSEYTVVSTETCAAVGVDEEKGLILCPTVATGTVAVITIGEGCVEGYPAEEEEETSDCSDCVSQASFDELYSMVMAQAETIEMLQSEVESLGELEETVSGVDQAMTDMATCMASYVMGDDTEEEEETTMMPEEPTMMETTVEPTKSPSMMPTETPPFYSATTDLDGMVCESGANRSFKNNFDSVDDCATRCLTDNDCMYFSYRPDTLQCIGCDVVPNASNDHTGEYDTYMMVTGRRQLSEIQMLRAENAALKKMLAEIRRN